METNAALKAQKEALNELRHSVETLDLRDPFRGCIDSSTSSGDDASQIITKNKDTLDTPEMKAEFERLEREIRMQYPYRAIIDAVRAQETSQTSFLESTSKVLNLVLSGFLAATAWTLVNQSREIAQLSKQLVANCTASVHAHCMEPPCARMPDYFRENSRDEIKTSSPPESSEGSSEESLEPRSPVSSLYKKDPYVRFLS